jgi:peptidoglycan/LPS O-acetylase OafA/YrhL
MLLVPTGALAYGAVRGERFGPALGALLFAAPFLILVSNPISANDDWGTPIRVPVVIMVIMVASIAYALARPPQAATGTA